MRKQDVIVGRMFWLRIHAHVHQHLRNPANFLANTAYDAMGEFVRLLCEHVGIN